MEVALTHPAAPADMPSIESLATAVRRRLPADFVAFLLQHNGCRVEPNMFPIGTDNDSGVTEFLGTEEILECQRRFDGRLPEVCLPVAHAKGGNLVLLVALADRWSVAFWDHETEDTWPIPGTFDDFLDMLKPFGPGNVSLKPGQVKSVWVDPDLLR